MKIMTKKAVALETLKPPEQWIPKSIEGVFQIELANNQIKKKLDEIKTAKQWKIQKICFMK